MPFKIVKVDGESMHPALAPGAFVLLQLYPHSDLQRSAALIMAISSLMGRLRLPFMLKIGDVVAVNHPKYGYIIKRVVCLEYKPVARLVQTNTWLNWAWRDAAYATVKRLRLQGDNIAVSTSEAAMGWVDAKYVIGKVVYQTRPVSTQ